MANKVVTLPAFEGRSIRVIEQRFDETGRLVMFHVNVDNGDSISLLIGADGAVTVEQDVEE
jgi:hypothetical protein